MNTRIILKRTILGLIFLSFLCATVAASAAVPAKINYQGKLKASGALVNASTPILFKIYDALSAGNLLWQSGNPAGTATTITVSNGLFTYVLGGLNAGTTDATDLSAIDWENKTCYLEVTVSGTALTPRELLIAVPYALSVKGLDVDTNNNVGIGTTNPGQKLDVAGDIQLNDNKLRLRPSSDNWHWLYFNTDGYEVFKANNGVEIGDGTTWYTRLAGASGGTSYFNAGNVGIGSTSPAQKLDVAGAIAISGTTVIDASRNLASIGSYNGYVPSQSATSTNSIYSLDSRSTNYLPQDRNAGLYADFKANSTDGLSDGGGYHGVLTFRSYGSTTDFSGGQASQIAYTDNSNLWARFGSTATWNAWKQIATSGMTNNFNFAGNVGIGTTTAPGSTLDVSGSGVDYVPQRWLNTSSGGGSWRISLPATGSGAVAGGLLFSNTAGSNNMILDSGGNVGIGYLNPGTAKLAINGNVGIGTTAPAGKLDVVAGAARTGTHGTTPSFYVTGSLGTGQTGPAANNIEFRHDNGTQGIGFGYNTIYQAGSNANQDLNLLSKGTSPITLNSYAYSTGNVGIGSTSPGYKLDVQGGAINASGGLYWNGSSLDNRYWTVSGSYNPMPSWTKVTSMSSGGGDMVIYQNGGQMSVVVDGALYANEGREIQSGSYYFSGTTFSLPGGTFASSVNFPGSGIWNSSGNVGIGTTTPNYKLSVAGEMSTGGTNLFRNGDLALGTLGWEDWGDYAGYTSTDTVVTDTTAPVQSQKALQHTVTAVGGSGDSGAMGQRAINLQPNTDYTVSAYVKTTSAMQGSFNIERHLVDWTGRNDVNSSYSYPTNGTWTRVSCTFNTSIYPNVTIGWRSFTATGTWYLTGFQLEKGPQMSSYSNSYADNIYYYTQAAGSPYGSLNSAVVPNNYGAGNLYAEYNVIANNGSGTVTNAYGNYIAAPINSGTITNKYALVTEANAGNVGIGSTTPTKKLDVAGDINFTGNLYQNSSLYISSQWVTSGSNIYYNTGNVGIGTTAAPGSILHIYKTNAALGFDAGLWIQSNPTDGTAERGGGITFQNLDVYTAGIYGVRDQVSSWQGGLAFYTHTSAAGNTFGTTFTEKMRISNTGNVGIGSISPGAKLDVNGNTSITGTLTTTSTINSQTIGATSSLAAVNMSGTLNVGTAYPGGGVTITSTGDVKASGNIYLYGSVYKENLQQLLVRNNSIRLNYGGTSQDAKIEVEGTGASTLSTIQWNNAASNWSIDKGLNITSGNVGIGSTSPGGKLEFGAQATGVDFMRFSPTDSSNYPTIIRTLNPASGGEFSPWLWKESSSPWGIWHDNANNDLHFTSSISTGALDSNVGGTSGAYTHFKISMDEGNLSSSGNLTINGTGNNYFAGNVGIGSVSPASKLSFGPQGGEGIANTIRVYDDGAVITSDNSNSYGIGMRSSDGRLAHTAGTGGYQVFYTANTERMRIISGGNVGIGTSVPSQKLEVLGTVKATSFDGAINTGGNIASSGNLLITGSGPHYIANGNVGIGTTGPVYQLDVYGTATGQRITGTGAYDANLVLGRSGVWDSGIRVYDNGHAEMRVWSQNTSGHIFLATGYNGNQATTLPTDGLQIAHNKVAIGVSGDYESGAKLQVNGGVSIGSGYQGTDPGTGNMIISGNVGIGSTAPGYKLDISGGDINIASGQAYRYNGQIIAYGQTANYNYFFGGGTGNLTMTGTYNTAIGYADLPANTSFQALPKRTF